MSSFGLLDYNAGYSYPSAFPSASDYTSAITSSFPAYPSDFTSLSSLPAPTYTSTIPTQPFTSTLPLSAPSYSTDFYGQNWASDPYGLNNPLSYSTLSYPTSTFPSFPGYDPTLSLPFGLQYPTLPSQGLDLPQLPSSRSHSPAFQDNLDSPYDEIANPYGMPSSPYDAPLPSSASRLRGRPTSPPRLPPRKSRYERERPSSPINDYQRHQSPPRNTTSFRSRSAERPREGYETSRGFLIPDETNHPVEQPIAPSAMRKWSHEDAAVLFRASRSGDLETLRSALESGYPINYVREQTGVTLFGKMKDTKGLMGKTITDVAGTDKVYSFLRNMGGKHAHELLARRRQKF